MRGLWNTKSTTRTQWRFSCYSKFHAKKQSTDRPPVWRSFLCVKLRVLEKKRLCVCVVRFRMLCELVHIDRELFLERWTHIYIWLIMNYMYRTWMSFFSPLSLSLLLSNRFWKRKFNWSEITENKFFHSLFVQKFLEKGHGNPVRNIGTKKTRVLVLRES